MKSQAELWAEWDRAEWQMGAEHCAALMLRGVAPSTILSAALGTEKIAIDGPFYTPEEDGADAIIQPIFEWQHPGPNIDANGYLRSEPPAESELVIVDMVAWRAEDPGKLWFRRGENALALGDDSIEQSIHDRTPVYLYLTPLSWLQSGCVGVCLVNPKHAQSKFKAVDAIWCETADQGRWFKRWIGEDEPYQKAPAVYVPSPQGNAA